MSLALRRALPLLLILALAACLPEIPATPNSASASPTATAIAATTPATAYPPPTTEAAYPLPTTPAAATAYPLPTAEEAYPLPTTPAAATAYPLPTAEEAYPLPTTPAAATAYPLPTVEGAYPLPTVEEAYPAPTAYPALEEDTVASNDAIAISQLLLDEDGVRVGGTSTLPDGACILTALTINDEPAAWWPVERCVTVREGQWVLTFERSSLDPADPPGARYVLTVHAPDYPEAGEVRYRVQAYIPYHSGGN